MKREKKKEGNISDCQLRIDRSGPSKRATFQHLAGDIQQQQKSITSLDNDETFFPLLNDGGKKTGKRFGGGNLSTRETQKGVLSGGTGATPPCQVGIGKSFEKGSRPRHRRRDRETVPSPKRDLVRVHHRRGIYTPVLAYLSCSASSLIGFRVAVTFKQRSGSKPGRKEAIASGRRLKPNV